MRREFFSAAVGVAAFAAGALVIRRGETTLGLCFIALAILRFVTLFSRRPRKPEPKIRLNLDQDGGDPPPESEI
jgi:hypothetical protein